MSRRSICVVAVFTVVALVPIMLPDMWKQPASLVIKEEQRAYDAIQGFAAVSVNEHGRIVALYFGEGPVPSDVLQELPELQELRTLQFLHSDVNDDACTFIVECKQLRQVYFVDTEISWNCIADIMVELPQFWWAQVTG